MRTSLDPGHAKVTDTDSGADPEFSCARSPFDSALSTKFSSHTLATTSKKKATKKHKQIKVFLAVQRGASTGSDKGNFIFAASSLIGGSFLWGYSYEDIEDELGNSYSL